MPDRKFREKRATRNMDKFIADMPRVDSDAQKRAARRFEKIVERAGDRLAKKKFPTARKDQEFGMVSDLVRKNPSAKVQKMTTDTFFRAIAEQQLRGEPKAFRNPANTPTGFFKDEALTPEGRRKLADIARRIAAGEPIDFPSLASDVAGRTVTEHEGRHRVATAHKMGIKELPVGVEFQAGRRNDLHFGGKGKNTFAKLREAITNQLKRVPSALNSTGKASGDLGGGDPSFLNRVFKKFGTGKAASLALGAVPFLGAVANAKDAVDAMHHLKRLKEDAEFRRERDQAMGRLRQPQNQTGVDPRGPGFRSRF